MTLPAFKAYDIRGRVPSELNEDMARQIGVAMAEQLGQGAVVLGRDVRLTSPALQQALAQGLRSVGREVIDKTGLKLSGAWTLALMAFPPDWCDDLPPDPLGTTPT